jgi:hypothetical protein
MLRHHWSVTTTRNTTSEVRLFHSFAEADKSFAADVAGGTSEGLKVAESAYWRTTLVTDGRSRTVALDDLGLRACDEDCAASSG